MTSYKRLGEFIEPIDERNSDLKVKLAQGINNNKYFQAPKQVATNSRADKIVRTGYFAYNRATTRNGDKISIAYRQGPDCTVSSAYQVFRIKDENLLNPKYLMMWYKRPDFDRYALYMSKGSAHEFFNWEEMCDVMLPVPSIEEQNRIVAEYDAIENRIAVNKRMIEKLEQTAIALYRHTFVEEIDQDNPPEGWIAGKLGDVAEITMGQSPSGSTYNFNGDGMIFFQGRADFGYRFPSARVYTTDPKRIAKEGDILLSVRAPVGDINIAPFECCVGRGLAALRSKTGKNSFLLYLLKSQSSHFNVANSDGTVFGSINKDTLNSIEIILPPLKVINDYNTKVSIFDKNIELKSKEISFLDKARKLILSKMASL